MELDADVLCLQEVDRMQHRSGLMDQAALAAEAIGAVDFRCAPTLHGTPGGRWTATTGALIGPGDAADGPMFGIALATRFPVRAWHRLALPGAPGRWPVLAPGTRTPILIADEPRVVLAAVLDAPGGAMTVATTHLSFAPGWNVWQLRQAIAFLRPLPAPRILVGDFNIPSRVARYASGWQVLAKAATYPASAPKIQLDHALGHGGVPAVLHVDAVRQPISDHRALVLDLADRPDQLH
jgi:endonuclease/exonuclease/phosphatase family metal-dependent hydrolase